MKHAMTRGGILAAACLLLCLPASVHAQITDATVVEDTALAGRLFERLTVTGITTPLPDRTTPGALDVPGFPGAAFISTGDLDADGRTEIVATSGGGSDLDLATPNGAVAVFTWDGSHFRHWQQHVINDTFAFPNETVLRDMDDDGDLDIMVLDNFIIPVNYAGIYYLENQGGDIGSPTNWIKRAIYVGDDSLKGKASYHRAVFFDADGDGDEDFVTGRTSMIRWLLGSRFMWTELFLNEGGGTYDGPYDIGDAGGFLFSMYDLDHDGDLDVICPQLFIYSPWTYRVRGAWWRHSFHGDSLVWLENPGTGPGLTAPWARHTIDNRYRTCGSIGRTFEALAADLQGDGTDELIVSTHNHQDYVVGKRIWPAGIFLYAIPDNPQHWWNWQPVAIDTGDMALDPEDYSVVLADSYAVDRPGDAYSQGAPGKFAIADFTGDGLNDIVVGGDGKGAIYLYRNDGMAGETLQLTRTTLYADRACMPAEVKAADLDHDGRPEIIAEVYDTSIAIKSEENPDLETKSSSIFIFRRR